MLVKSELAQRREGRMTNSWPADWRERDYYAIIGVPVTATQEQIERAYRQHARSTHPDLDPDNPDAAEQFSVLADAHAMLGDPASRAAYDRARAAIRERAKRPHSAAEQRPTPVLGRRPPRPAGATVRPGPVIWTPSTRPTQPGDRR
jgi:curved DNA-binding protein CbpA